MSRSRQTGRTLLFLICVAGVAGLPPAARAYDFEVSARTEGYAYQLRRYDLDGIRFLNRRRLTQWLGLRIFNLLDPGQRPWSPGGRRQPALLNVHALLRLDVDFGSYADKEAGVPEVERSELDLLLGGVEGRGLFGWLDVDLGRQLDIELLDFFAFDGLRLRGNLPWGLYLEVFGGVQVAGAHDFSSAVFETEGVPGDPARDAWSPSYGVAAGLEGGPAGMQLRLAYRGVSSSASPTPSHPGAPPSASVWGVDQEVLFFAARVEVPWLRLRPQIGARYNLLTTELDDLELAATLPLASRGELEVQFLRSRPHFDGDSILNLFSLEPTSDLSGWLAWQLLPSLRLGLRMGYRWFWAPTEEGHSREPSVVTAGLSGRWSSQRLRAELEGYYQGGRQGATMGADLDGAFQLRRWLALEGRLSLLRFFDSQRQVGPFLAFGAQAGARLNFARGVLLHLLLEDNVSRLYRSALRVLAVLDLEFAP